MDDAEGITWIEDDADGPPSDAPPLQHPSGDTISLVAGAVLGACAMSSGFDELGLLVHALGGALVGYVAWRGLALMVRGSLRTSRGRAADADRCAGPSGASRRG